MSIVEVFGGGVVQPAQVSYRAISLTANVTLLWPNLSSTSTDVVARINNVTPSAPLLSITMPDATQVGNGMDALFRNLGASTFTVKDSSGGTIGTVATGVSIYFYLTDNSTSAGSWSLVTFGTGTSSADAATLAGFGIKAISTTLNQKHDVTEVTANVTVDSTYRAKTVVWTSGSFTCTLPTAVSVGSDFFLILKNAGTGTVSIALSGGDTIDGNASLDLSPNDGVIVYSAGASNKYYTVAQGRNVSFAFTQLVKNVAGSANVTLTSAECANKLMTFTGVLTGNISVYVTNIASVYYTFNNTTGAFTLTVSTVAGTGVAISQTAHDILTCDATNIYRAITNQAATNYFDTGSQTVPSISFVGDTDTGIYRQAANTVGITGNGTKIVTFFNSAGTTSITATGSGASANGFSFATTTDASNSITSSTSGNGDAWLQASSSGTGDVYTLYGTGGSVWYTGIDNSAADRYIIGTSTPGAADWLILTVTGGLTLNGTTLAVPNNLNIASNVMFIDSTKNKVAINSSSILTTNVESRLQMHGTSQATSTFSSTNWQASVNGASIELGHSRGSVGTTTAVTTGDQLGFINFIGATASDFSIGAQFRTYAQETFVSAGARGTAIEVGATPNGGSAVGFNFVMGATSDIVKIGLGAPFSASTSVLPSAMLHVADGSNNTANPERSEVRIQRGVSNAAVSPLLTMYKNRGNSITAPAAIVTGDDIGEWRGYAYVGATNQFLNPVGILFDSTGTITDATTGVGGIIRMKTAKQGTDTASVERLRVDDVGHVVSIAGTANTPVIGSGFGTTPSITGTDNAFVVTIGSGGVATTGVVSFASSYANAPIVVVANDTDKVAYQVQPTTAQVTITATAAFTAGSKLYCMVLGRA